MIELSTLYRFTGKQVCVIDGEKIYQGEAVGEEIWSGAQVIRILLDQPLGAATELYAPSDMVKIDGLCQMAIPNIPTPASSSA